MLKFNIFHDQSRGVITNIPKFGVSVISLVKGNQVMKFLPEIFYSYVSKSQPTRSGGRK